MIQNENNNYEGLLKPTTDFLEMQFNQFCVIAVTDISIFKSRSHPPETQIGSFSYKMIMVAGNGNGLQL